MDWKTAGGWRDRFLPGLASAGETKEGGGPGKGVRATREGRGFRGRGRWVWVVGVAAAGKGVLHTELGTED